MSNIHSSPPPVHNSDRLPHLRSLTAFSLFVMGSLVFYVLAVVASLCLISFFMMFAGESVTYYWLWSLSLALPPWFAGSYWLFRRILLRALLATEPTDRQRDGASDAEPNPRPWANA